MRYIFVLALLCPALCMCQPLSIRGKITNDAGDSIPAVTITVKPQTGGSQPPTSNLQRQTSLADGSFTITNLRLGDTLLFTASGYASHTEIFDRSLFGRSVTIVLKRPATSLDEVVVIAYGTTTRRTATGNISRVTASQISNQPVSNPIAALQGLVPGLFITQANGLPGSNFSIQLRGLNSLKGGTQPLFIIDGVPMMLNTANLGQINSANNNIFNLVNPSDILSIEVLKDADATAIYGSQGANGVVLITTRKRGGANTSLDVSYNTGWGRVTRLLPLLSTSDYIAMRREAFRNDGVLPTVSTAPDLLVWDTIAYTNWQKELLGGTARTQTAQASLSGGSGATRFIFSTSYYTERTVFPSSLPYRRGTARLSVTHNTARFKSSVSAFYSTDKKALPLTDLTTYTFLPPNTPSPYDSAGGLAWAAGIENPFAYTLRTYAATGSNLTGNLSLEYAFPFGLIVHTVAGYNGLSLSEELAIPIKAQRPSSTTTGTAQWTASSNTSWLLEPYAEYKQRVGQGRLTLLAGLSWQQRGAVGASVTGTRYTTDDLLGVQAAAGQLALTNYRSQYKYTAVFGRLNYTLKSRYILNVNIRRDGSSRFGPANRFSTFSSIGGAWVLSEESFMKKAKGWLSFAKLRGSYGITGNDQIGDYQYLDAWSTASAYAYNGAAAGVLPARLYNPAFQWETVRKLEGGLSLGFFGQRLEMELSVFRNRSSNQLVPYRLPQISGFASILQNLDAEIQNSGLEVEVSGKPLQTAGFNWSASFNLSVIRNKLLSYPGIEASSDKYTYAIGQPLRIMYGYAYTGISKATGVYTFQDLDGNGTISQPGDLQIVGAPGPDFYGGLTNRLQWGSFEFSCLFQFVRQTGRNYLYTFANIPGIMANVPAFVLDRWQAPGDDPLVQKFTATASSDAFKAYALFRSSSKSLSDASYIRLRNLHLAWHLPKGWLAKMKAYAGSLFVQGQNLLTITGYKGADPETQSLTSLPPLRLFTAGIQFTF